MSSVYLLDSLWRFDPAGAQRFCEGAGIDCVGLSFGDGLGNLRGASLRALSRRYRVVGLRIGVLTMTLGEGVFRSEARLRAALEGLCSAVDLFSPDRVVVTGDFSLEPRVQEVMVLAFDYFSWRVSRAGAKLCLDPSRYLLLGGSLRRFLDFVSFFGGTLSWVLPVGAFMRGGLPARGLLVGCGGISLEFPLGSWPGLVTLGSWRRAVDGFGAVPVICGGVETFQGVGEALAVLG